MSKFNDEQSEIEYVEVGDAFNDGKGELLPITMKAVNTNFRLIIEYLSGGSGNVKLTNPLPISRGGLESTTAAGGRSNLGLVIDPNNEIVLGNGSIELYNDKYTKYGKVNNEHAFKRTGVGTYTMSSLAKFGSLGFKFKLPKDDLGNVLVGAVITFASNVMTVKTYAISYTNGKATINTASPLDIPSGRFILINATA